MKLVGYLRVSSESQIDGYGLDVQLTDIRSWARTHNHRIVDIIRDGGVSDALEATDREGLSAALAYFSQPRQADGLLIPKLDRLARALTVQEAALALV